MGGVVGGWVGGGEQGDVCGHAAAVDGSSVSRAAAAPSKDPLHAHAAKKTGGAARPAAARLVAAARRLYELLQFGHAQVGLENHHGPARLKFQG